MHAQHDAGKPNRLIHPFVAIVIQAYGEHTCKREKGGLRRDGRSGLPRQLLLAVEHMVVIVAWTAVTDCCCLAFSRRCLFPSCSPTPTRRTKCTWLSGPSRQLSTLGETFFGPPPSTLRPNQADLHVATVDLSSDRLRSSLPCALGVTRHKPSRLASTFVPSSPLLPKTLKKRVPQSITAAAVYISPSGWRMYV